MNTGPHIPGSKWKLLAAAAAATSILSFLLSASPAPAAEVIVVTDTEIKPYRDAIEGFKRACDCSVRELDLADLDSIEKAIRARPDAVFAVGTRAFRKMRVIRDVPLIYTMVMPSEAADSNSGNLSGVSMDIAPETYLSVMSRLFPREKRIGVLFDPEHTGPFVRQAAAAASARGVTLTAKPMRDPRRAPALLEQLRGKVDILWMIPDATVVNSETVDYLTLFSFGNNIPLFSFSEKYVEKGAVAALKIDPGDMGVQAGEIARTLFDGGKGPGRVFARTARLVVNRKVGAKMGVRIDDELVRNAEKVE